jgi:Heterokaryon incompatibility protein (HET)
MDLPSYDGHQRRVFEDLTSESLARLDPNWINLDTLKLWLQTCDEQHGAKCGHSHYMDPRSRLHLNYRAPLPDGSKVQKSTNLSERLWPRKSLLRGKSLAGHEHPILPNSPPNKAAKPNQAPKNKIAVPTQHEHGRPQWLICVQQGCLVKATADKQYAALSYVWGQVPTLKTTKGNLNELLKGAALFKQGDFVPRTIRHTIALVQQLDISYLWVDCLCIFQDDKENLHRQLQDMASIYAFAYVTIVAANGWDANHGLRGVHGVTDARHLSPNDASDTYESLQPYNSIWYSRGWTFQEMVFSRRTIML